jgi:hypothetical protein
MRTIAIEIAPMKATAGMVAVTIVALGVLMLAAIAACPDAAQAQDRQLQQATQLNNRTCVNGQCALSYLAGH